MEEHILWKDGKPHEIICVAKGEVTEILWMPALRRPGGNSRKMRPLGVGFCDAFKQLAGIHGQSVEKSYNNTITSKVEGE
jgi:hypothetical protein